VIKVQFQKEMREFLLQLKENFTYYRLHHILLLKSSYSIRIYELLKQYQSIGRREIGLDDLRRKLGLDKKKLARYPDFKRKVILVAQEELGEKTDIRFDFQEVKSGRKVVKLIFEISQNEADVKGLELDKIRDRLLGKDREQKDIEQRLQLLGFSSEEAQRYYEKGFELVTLDNLNQKENQQMREQVAAKYGSVYAYFSEKIELTEKKKKGLDNPAGFLVQALRCNYQPETAKVAKGGLFSSRRPKGKPSTLSAPSQDKVTALQAAYIAKQREICIQLFEENESLLMHIVQERNLRVKGTDYDAICKEKATAGVAIRQYLDTHFPDRFRETRKLREQIEQLSA
jgi:hypothetical protein